MANIPYQAADHALYITTHDDITFSFQGEPDGDFIVVSYDNDTVTAQEGAKGDVQYSQRVASLGTIVATCQWQSLSNENLNKVFKDQQNSLFMKRAEVKRISNTENTTVCTSLEPMIMKTPDYGLGTTAADRAWSFKVKNLTFEETTAPA